MCKFNFFELILFQVHVSESANIDSHQEQSSSTRTNFIATDDIEDYWEGAGKVPKKRRNPRALFTADVRKDNHEYIITVKSLSHEWPPISKTSKQIKELREKCKIEIPVVEEIFGKQSDVKGKGKLAKYQEFLDLLLERPTISAELQEEVRLFLELSGADNGTFPLFSPPAECSGWLFKKARSNSVGNWTKRFFQLDVSARMLIYCKDTEQNFDERERLYEGVSCEKVDDPNFLDTCRSAYKFFFRVKRKTELLFELAARNESDRNMWISEINKICVSESFCLHLFLSSSCFAQLSANDLSMFLCRAKYHRMGPSLVPIALM